MEFGQDQRSDKTSGFDIMFGTGEHTLQKNLAQSRGRRDQQRRCVAISVRRVFGSAAEDSYLVLYFKMESVYFFPLVIHHR